MRAVIQRVIESSVEINNSKVSFIKKGLLVFLGVELNDTCDDAKWLASKISTLRIFNDKSLKNNKSVKDVGAEIMVVSQFTLHASIKKGSRPSFIKSAKSDDAINLYDQFKSNLSQAIGKPVKSGVFGANMNVSLINDGPYTIFIDTKDKN